MNRGYVGLAIAAAAAACGNDGLVSVPGDAGASGSSSSSGSVTVSSSSSSSGVSSSSSSGSSTSSSSGGGSTSSSGSEGDGSSVSGDGGTDSSSGSNFDAAVFDGPLPDSSGSPITTFEIIYGGGLIETPLSCPTSHWEFPLPSGGPLTLRNTGSVPLAYISEPMAYIAGVKYTPGVPTSEAGELVGVLAPGAIVSLGSVAMDGNLLTLVGASKPFSIYDGGFAPADEWTTPWPMGVTGSEGGTTMYVAEATWNTTCAPVSGP